jgi:hypothetical protein
MRFVIAIDVGVRNLGLCIFDFQLSKFVLWDNVSLVPNGKYIPSNNVQYVHDFLKRYEVFFDEVACVLIERQMRCNMRIIESVIHALHFDKTIVINARAVKAHYGISMRNYRLNKQKAVEWASNFVAANKRAFAIGAVDKFEIRSKRDDFADSLLLVLYYLDTYSNQLTTEDLFADVRALGVL